jgi:hypothetical protein
MAEPNLVCKCNVPGVRLCIFVHPGKTSVIRNCINGGVHSAKRLNIDKEKMNNNTITLEVRINKIKAHRPYRVDHETAIKHQPGINNSSERVLVAHRVIA